MRRLLALLSVCLFSFVVASCGDDDGGDAGADTTTTAAETTTTTVEGTTTTTTTVVEETTTTTTAPPPLTVLVTNDDGVEAEGIDALVEMLVARGDLEVIVVAPDGNRSGSSDTITEDAEVTAVDTATLSGHPAVGVSGFPADAVRHALDVMGVQPDLVISGINDGANIGPFVELSGTVGAARTAARAGHPALAASQGIGEPPDFAAGVEVVAGWLDDHIDELRTGPGPFVDSVNIPTCPAGELRGVVEVPTATDFGDRNALESDCTSDAVDPADDVDAINVGYASLAELTY